MTVTKRRIVVKKRDTGTIVASEVYDDSDGWAAHDAALNKYGAVGSGLSAVSSPVPMRTRNITVQSAEYEVGYGYVMYASHDDWREIAAAMGEHELDYITTTIIDYSPDEYETVGIHFDAAQLAEVFEAIASLDIN